MWRARLTIKYIFFEMLPSFIMGILVFVFILLMFQALRLTEFIIIHGVELEVVLRIMLYLSVSFLPVILPMSLMFSILLTYGRLSSDSEIVAFRSLGLNLSHLSFPALLLSAITALVSARTSFQLGPWGNRQFEVIVSRIGSVGVAATIKEGIFSEGFFDLVVYANKVDPRTGELENVFIFDEKDPNLPLTIIARSGLLLKNPEGPGNSAVLRLKDGNIHRSSGTTYTKIDFAQYDINLLDSTKESIKKKSLLSLSMQEIKEALNSDDLDKKERIRLEIEFHKRWAISLACPLFALLGVGFGIVSNRRSGKSSGMVICLVLIVSYWMLYIVSENLAKNEVLPPWLAGWVTNAVFAVLGAWKIRQARGNSG